MSFGSSLGASALDNTTSGLMGNIGVVDYYINPLAQAGYDKWWSDARENEIANQRAANNLSLEYYPLFADAQYDAMARNAPKMMQAQRLALEQSGYNPILAVNSAGGASFSNAFPQSSISSPEAPRTNPRGSSIMENLSKAALIDQTNAQTRLIDRKTLGEGWTVKTLSRSEAMGLGASLAHTLGFNFHDSSQTTFLVAYNAITGELRNIGDTESGLGSTAPASNAAEVNAIPVDWQTDKSPRYKFNPDDWELKPEYRK